MPLLDIILIALALAMDAFAVAVSTAVWLRRVDGRQTFRMSFHFGLFQFLMPVIGWFAGDRFASLIAGFDHWIAFVLLAVIGGRMVHAAWSGDGAPVRSDVTRGLSLIGLSIATSIDALAVGLSLAMIGESIMFPAVIIGLVAGAMTLLGMRLGGAVPRRLGRLLESAGGVILIGIGIRIVIEHLALI